MLPRPLQARPRLVVVICIPIVVAALVSTGCTPSAVKKQQYFEKGNEYYAKAMYSHAIIEYRNAIALDATFGEARKKLAQAYAQSGNPAGAFGEYIRAADLLPNDVGAQIDAGTLLLGARKPQEALARAEAALKVDPNHVQALVLRGSALAGLTSFDEALKSIEGAIQLDPDRGRTYSALGLVVLAQGKRDQSEAAFRRAVALSPNDLQVHLALGNFYLAVGRGKDAEQAFQSALKLDPDNTAANRFMASVTLTTGRQAEAETYLRRIADSAKDSYGPLALADYYVMMGRPKDAITRLEALPNSGTVTEVTLRLARAYSALGDQAKAEALVNESLEANPKDAGVQLLKGQFLLKAGNRGAAFDAVRAATAADPSSADAQYALGRLYAARGDIAAAQTAFREALRINPRANAAQVELARLQAQTGKPEDAVRIAGEAARNQPTNLAARLVLARSLITAGSFVRAAEELDKLRAEFPEAASVHAQQGRLALLKNNLPAAQSSLEHAEKLDPSSIETLGLLVTLDLKQNNQAKARARIEEQLRATNSSDLLLLAARTYVTLKDPAAAEQTLRKAINVDPSVITSYEMLGRLYLSQNKLDEALREFEAIAAKQVKPVASLTMIGMILEQQGKRDLAKKQYEQALSLDSSAATAGNNLAWILAETGEDLDRALQLAKTATAASPDAPQVMDTLGWVHYKRREPLLAIPLFQRSIELAPANGWYHYHLGLAHNLAGDPARGRIALQQAMKAGTDSATAAEIGKILGRSATTLN